MRARMSSPERRRERLKKEMTKLERMQDRLEKDIDSIREEIDTLEEIEELEAKRHREFSWITGRITTLALQDFVGAAFGALFFVVTQEVWDLSSRLTLVNLTGVFFMSFIMTFLLVYLSRRRKSLSSRLYHTSFLRGLEIYAVSLVTAVVFVVLFNTARASA